MPRCGHSHRQQEYNPRKSRGKSKNNGRGHTTNKEHRSSIVTQLALGAVIACARACAFAKHIAIVRLMLSRAIASDCDGNRSEACDGTRVCAHASRANSGAACPEPPWGNVAWQKGQAGLRCCAQVGRVSALVQCVACMRSAFRVCRACDVCVATCACTALRGNTAPAHAHLQRAVLWIQHCTSGSTPSGVLVVRATLSASHRCRERHAGVYWRLHAQCNINGMDDGTRHGRSRGSAAIVAAMAMAAQTWRNA